MPQSTSELLRLVNENASAAFDVALSLPPKIYHSAEILDLETDRLFHRGWICVGRMAEMPGHGDYICRDVVDTPVFVVRQQDCSVRAFANVCAHRSARLLNADGHATRISCPYHSWTYGTDGKLVGAPFMDKTKGFDVKNHKLKEYACEVWEGFVYVNLSSDARSIVSSLHELLTQVGDFRMSDYVPVFSRVDVWNTNWKCLVENFMDAYHLHRVHKSSFGKYGTSEDITELYPGGDAFTYHYVQEDQDPRSVQAHPDNTWLVGPNRNRTWLINIFPSHMIQLQPDMLWYLSLLPRGTGVVEIRWAVSVPKEILDSATDRQNVIDEVMQLLHQVNDEDKVIVENVFRSTRSPDAQRGPLSYLERNVWEFGRYLARELSGNAL